MAIFPHPTILIVLRRKALEAKSRRRPVRFAKPTKPRSPKAVQMEYMRLLNGMTKTLRDLYKGYLFPELDRILATAKSTRPDAMTVDDYSTEARRAIDNLKLLFQEKYSDAEILAITQKIAAKTSAFNADELRRSYGKVLGVEVFAGEPWLQQELNSFTRDNVLLIKKLTNTLYDETEMIIKRGARAGESTKSISERLQERLDVSESRADFIARDQVAKFNGDMMQLRQTSIGIRKYQWSTSHDERVRDTHAANDGKIFEWNNPPATGNPGQDFNCRCVAIPYFEEIITNAKESA